MGGAPKPNEPPGKPPNPPAGPPPPRNSAGPGTAGWPATKVPPRSPGGGGVGRAGEADRPPPPPKSPGRRPGPGTPKGRPAAPAPPRPGGGSRRRGASPGRPPRPAPALSPRPRGRLSIPATRWRAGGLLRRRSLVRRETGGITATSEGPICSVMPEVVARRPPEDLKIGIIGLLSGTRDRWPLRLAKSPKKKQERHTATCSPLGVESHLPLNCHTRWSSLVPHRSHTPRGSRAAGRGGLRVRLRLRSPATLRGIADRVGHSPVPILALILSS